MVMAQALGLGVISLAPGAVVGIGIAVLAAYLPARRAAGLRIVEALQYE